MNLPIRRWQTIVRRTFMGEPRVVLSVPPSLAPPTFCKTSLRLRPMHALRHKHHGQKTAARQPQQPCAVTGSQKRSGGGHKRSLQHEKGIGIMPTKPNKDLLCPVT